MAGHRFHSSILREYDVRGVVGETLGEADAYALGRSFATMVWQARRDGAESVAAMGGTVPWVAVGTASGETSPPRAGNGQGEPASHSRQGRTPDTHHRPSPSDAPRVAVGRDGRISSPMLEAALVRGLVDGGVDVVRVGLGPTPMLYFAEASAEDVEGGIHVTGSHNPANHNGFKMVLGGLPVHGAAIVRLGMIAAAGDWHEGVGRTELQDVLPAYVARVLLGLDGIAAKDLEGLRMGWDAGNGAAGPALQLLTSQLPGEHHLLFSDVDGSFPNHHPDPTVEANLADLQSLVAAKNLDFGVAFDGDGDRIGIVDGRGRPIWGDEALALFAADVLARSPGATVIGDVKASQAVFDRIAALGGKPVMAPSGHSLIKTVLKETGALLGGETSAHVFFADDWYGFDDALYAAVRLIAATVRLRRTVTQMRDELPATISTPELRFAVAEARKFDAVEEVRARLAGQGAEVIAIDGVRVVRPDGWWLLRASNTQAALTARAESTTQTGLARLLAEIDAELALCGLSRAES